MAKLDRIEYDIKGTCLATVLIKQLGLASQYKQLAFS